MEISSNLNETFAQNSASNASNKANSFASGADHLISCGQSAAFYNKTILNGGKNAFSRSFMPVAVTTADFVRHITSGSAWTQGCFKDHKRRKENFISAQTLALDLDDHISVNDAISEPFIRRYALLVHPSPSSTPEHPKTRVIFVLDAPVQGVERWEALQRALIALFAHLRPDAACKDAARLFFGCDLHEQHNKAFTQLNARLPVALMGAYTWDEAQAENLRFGQVQKLRTGSSFPLIKARETGRAGTPQPLPTIDPGDVSPDLVRDVEKALGVWGASTNSAGFNRTPVACPVKHHEHDHTTPAAYWHPGIHALTCFKCGETYNTHQVAAALNIDIAPYYRHETAYDRVRRVFDDSYIKEAASSLVMGAGHFSANMRVNIDYVSRLPLREMLQYRAVLIKSPIGTGKTQAAADLIKVMAQQSKRSPRVLALTHRQSLAEDLTQRLNKGSDFIFECYKGLDAIDLRRIDRLVVCYDSVWKLAAVGNKLPEFDLIMIDEMEQFHAHLGGDTMKNGEPERAYRVLRQLVIETPHLLGMDAHMSDVCKSWVENLTQGEVLCIENSVEKDRGTLVLHERRETAVSSAMALVQENAGAVVLPTNSRSTAKKLGKVFADAFGEENVRVIHGGNSNDRDVQAFIANINEHLKTLKVLIYSPSLGTGVDITTPVRAVVGIFSRQPISPADMHQMMGRCRTAPIRHAWIDPTESKLETDWIRIYSRHEQNALKTGLHCEFDQHGILAVAPIQQSMLKLLSMLEAQRHRAMSAPLAAFASLARQDGFVLAFCGGKDENIRNQIKEAGVAVAQFEKESVLNADPITHEELELLRAQGQLTSEAQAGYERFKIEDCVGQPITPQIYDDLHTSTQRDMLRRFTDLSEDEEVIRDYDRREAHKGLLLSKRKHRAIRRKLMQDLITAVWGEDALAALEKGAQSQVTAEFINERIGDYLDAHRQDLISYMGWRADQSDNPVSILRWLLKQMGVYLISTQVMRDRVRFRLYSIDAAGLQKMQGYRISRQAHLEQKRKAAEEKQGAKAVYSNSDYISIPTGVEEWHSYREEDALPAKRARSHEKNMSS